MQNWTNLERIVSGLLALLLVGGSLVATIVSVAHGGQPPALPEWLIGATTMVVGYYFGAHLNTTNGTQSNGTQSGNGRPSAGGGDSGSTGIMSGMVRTGQDNGSKQG